MSDRIKACGAWTVFLRSGFTGPEGGTTVATANERGEQRRDTRDGRRVLCPRDQRTGALKAGQPYQFDDYGRAVPWYAP
jgi:hypothetical protein